MLIEDFKKPKSESQCITELKEIKQGTHEFVWDFDHKFKAFLDQFNFFMAPVHHKQWFIHVLLPHIRLPLMQQKVVLYTKALEIVMKLKASPVGETSIYMV